MRSPAFDGDLELGTDRPPDVARLDTGLEGLLDRAAVERGEHVVGADGPGAHRTELVGHELPEAGQTHPSEGKDGVGPDRRRAGSPTVADVDALLLVVGQIDLHSTGPAWLWDVAGVLALVAVLVVLLRWWSSQRRR